MPRHINKVVLMTLIMFMMFSEPGKSERKQFADSCARVEIARKKLGRSYCHLVLGVGLEDAHHMGCGR